MKYDVVIVGGGPCGLAAAIEAKKLNLSYTVIEKGNVVESIRRYPYNMKFFSTSEMLEIGGLPFPTVEMRPSRMEAVKYYQKAVKAYDLNITAFHEVIHITGSEGEFTIHTNKKTIKTRYVIVATGYYDIPRMLDVPGENLSHVSHYYTEPYQYFDQEVVVVGGANSAVETALDLYRNGARVTLVHKFEDLDRTAKYWIAPDLKNRIKKAEVTSYFHATVKEITHDKVIITQNGNTIEIPAAFIFLMVGYRPDAELLQKIGIKLNGEALIPDIDSESYESNMKGIFLAGSIIGGEETAKVFIENGRHHGKPIMEEISRRLLID